MLDTLFSKEIFYLSVFEIGDVVTSIFLDLDIKIILCPSQELL
jgi:hypothetical protein